MIQKNYQIDAFAEKVFSGNPAAVCQLSEWLGDEELQNIAMENNLAETAFYLKQKNECQFRWFTPKGEVDLCVHATLAAAYVLFNHENYSDNIITFYSPRSGKPTVIKPKDIYESIELSKELTNDFDVLSVEALKGNTGELPEYGHEYQIMNIQAGLTKIANLPRRGVRVSAKRDNVDFVSRFFCAPIGHR
ncbi:MAG: PhzF family phenazine biosynthesis isomerase [Bacteroidota bacterium]